LCFKVIALPALEVETSLYSVFYPKTKHHISDVGREHHDTERGAEALGRQVGAELSADESVVAVGAGNLAPDRADLVALLVSLSHAVHVRNTLAQVVERLGAVSDTLKLENACVGDVVALHAAVAGVNGLGPEPRRLLGLAALDNTRHL